MKRIIMINDKEELFKVIQKLKKDTSYSIKIKKDKIIITNTIVIKSLDYWNKDSSEYLS
jgi:hypothetical protein